GQIPRTVADARNARHVDTEASVEFQQLAGSRFDAFALRIGAVGTKEDRIDASTTLRKRLVHALMDCVQRRDIQQSPTDAGLIGRDNNAIAGMIEARNGLETSGYRSPLVGRFDELIAVVIDDPVAIENDEPRRTRRNNGFGSELNHALHARRRAAACLDQ